VKEKRNEYMRAYYKTRRGRIAHIHKSQKHGAKVRGHVAPSYSADELEIWAQANGFEVLYVAWEASGFSKELAPSTDRLDNSKSYAFSNLRLVTWKENREKSYVDRKANTLITAQNVKVEQLTLSGEIVRIHDSIESAAREVNGSSANILKVCQNKPYHKSVKGFRWRFAI
jgi:hypothetical protein